MADPRTLLEKRIRGTTRAAAFRKAKWLTWKATRNLKKRHEAWLLWQHALDELHRLERQLHGLPITRASMDVVHGIAAWEGGGNGRDSKGRLIFKPYHDSIDPPGVNTQGFGHIENVSLSDKPWSLPKAYEVLRDDLDKKYAPYVVAYAKRYGTRLNQKQFDALVSFVYNLGPGYFEPNHDPGAAWQARDFKRLARTFAEFNKSEGQVREGLVRRRRWETDLFLGGSYTVNN